MSIPARIRASRSCRHGTIVVLTGVLAVLCLIVGLPSPAQPRGAAAAADRGGAPVPSVPDQAVAGGANPAIVELVRRVDRERALDELRRLSGDRPLCVGTDCRTIANRVTSGPGLAWALRYITATVDGLGYDVTVHSWTRLPLFDRNVVLRKTGVISPSEAVYFVAHVDGVNDCPAADDNGSGTVAGLEMARAFADTVFARTIVLLFTSGEEQGMLGARAYIRDLSPQALADVHVLLNLDMVGYDSDGDKVMEIYHGDHGPSVAMAESMRALVPAYDLDLDPVINPGCG